MRALVIKDQHVPSGNIAQIIQQYFVKEDENFNVYGSLILGNTQGGLNPPGLISTAAASFFPRSATFSG